MDAATLPPNVYHRLMLVGGDMIMSNSPLPGGKPGDPKVFLIVFTPAKTDSFLTGDGSDAEGESRVNVPAKYLILMREADGTLGQNVQIHEIWADKVLVSSRIASQKAAIEEFTDLLREELGDDAPVDLLGLQKPNGQAAATP